MKEKDRYTWQNEVKNQTVQPLKYYMPCCLNDLKDIIHRAEAENITVRAVGSGLSFSDVVQTSGFLVSTDKLQKILPLDKTLLRAEVNPNLLVHAEGGIKISRLNKYLDRHDLALPNMGGFDGQSIAGACATSTHGSGLGLGPITSFYRSITLVAAGGKVYQIEPTDGITDPKAHYKAFPNSAITLVQDDNWFNTVSVSMGCTGIIYSVIMEMIPKYWLEENRYLSTWEEVKARLKDGKCLTDNRHFEVLINPYKRKGDHLCLVTERNFASRPKTGRRKWGRRFFTLFLGFMPLILKALDYFFNHFLNLIPWFISFAMKRLVVKDHINISYNILNLGAPNYISAYSAEFAFPLENNTYIDAVESMFPIAEKARKEGRIYHTSPISIRFIKAYDGYLSMMNNRPTCSVEVPFVNYSHGGFELLQIYQNNAGKFNGRVHWGQVNTICTNAGEVSKSFPDYHKWQAVYKQLNCNGTFNNTFTNRMGLSIH